MPFCLHLNTLIFYLLICLFWIQDDFFLFPLFCLFFFFPPGFLQKKNLCLNLIVPEHWGLSCGGKSSFPLSLFGVPSPSQKTASPGSSSPGREVQWNAWFTLSQSRENSHLSITTTGGFYLTGFVLLLCGLKFMHQTQRIKEAAAALGQLLAQQSTVQWFWCCWSTLG